MKSNHFLLKGLILLAGLTTFKSFGQLSGTVTINSAAAVSATNFQSFTTLAATLNSVGISGPLLINVAPNSGPYTEQPVFMQAPGVSAINTITINGNHNLLTYTNGSMGGALAQALLLKGADHMYFNNLNMSAFGTSYHAVACQLCEGADYNNFSGCTFSCVPNNSTFSELALAISSSSTSPEAPGTGNAGSFNKFDSCTMFSGSYAVYLSGSPAIPYNTGNTFSNCHMIDWGYYGIYAEYQENLTVKDCHIDRPTRPQFAVGYGLGFYRNPGGLLCERNCIENLAGGFPGTTGHIHGIHYDASSMPSGLAPSTFSNNVISNIVTNGAAYGMQIVSLNGRCVSNTVALNNGAFTSTGACYAFYAEPANAAPDSMRVLYNYFSLTHNGSGQKYCSYFTSAARTVVDDNRYYIAPGNAGSNNIGYYNSALNTFAQWQAQGMDLHGMSYSVDPNAGKPLSCSSTTTTINTNTSVATSMHNASQVTGVSVKIFPNPATNELSVELTNGEGKHIDMLDISGRSVFSITSAADKIKINTAELPAGIYFVKVRSGNLWEVLKVIKE